MSLRISQSFAFHAAVLIFMCISMPLLHNATSTTATTTTESTCCNNETDRSALLSIKAHITDDPMLLTSSWNDSLHFCQWQGVSCGRRHQRVTVLNLQSCSLAGSISPSIGNLSFLRIIDLSNNTFQGDIPHGIGLLYRLQVLNLVNNSLEGQIPANLSGCSNMRFLGLRGNKLIGKLPMELGSLSKLVNLHIRNNNLTGKIPPSFGNLSFLEVLEARENMLEGSIPNSLGQLKSLKVLEFALNQLSGKIPPSIYNLSSIKRFGLAANRFQGSLPLNLGLTLPNLQWLLIWGNQFSGSIPVSLSNASNLQELDISTNKFSRGMPLKFGNMQNLYWLAMGDCYLGSGKEDDLNFITSLTNCSNLRFLFLGGNNFGGMLPSSIANLSTKLEYFSVAGNEISGNVPTGIGNLVSMTSLNMQSNQLKGSLPISIGLLHKVQEMGFGENKLSGEIPFSIGNLTLLNQLWLEENNFQGSIPSTLGNCKSLFLLHLYGNNLSGNIPGEVIGLSSLTKSLSLDQNHLTGPLPLEVGNLKNLVELNVSHNELSGEIPSTLGGCISLERLYMDYNSFEGAIPRSLSSLKGIEELDLSHNNISGEIPKDLSTIHGLRNLNLSFNDLEGEVPVGGVFANTSAVSISGNKRLCGGISALQLPVCSIIEQKKKKSLVFKLIIPIICAVVGIILMSSFLILWWRKKTRKRPSSTSSLMDPLMNISYRDLLKATNGFSPTNLIGTGSFGSVYKGILNENALAIAVKVLNLQRRGAFKSFMAECKALRNVRHRNLVKILTACSSIDFHGNDFKALVYEFMPNGSIENWLYPFRQTGDIPEGLRSLNLFQRLNIAIDVASALDYLHNHCQVSIIHCDLKPSNILLDDDMTAHVGDFGLARFLKPYENEISQNQTSSVSIKGTIGYAAPEYGMGSEVSTHGDVYSFGILLLEMFTGKKPSDSMFNDGLNLHILVGMALPERVMEIVDQVLLPGVEKEEETTSNTRANARMWKISECLVSILRIGVACSKESPRERISISEAAKELHLIKGMLLENGTYNKVYTIQKEQLEG